MTTLDEEICFAVVASTVEKKKLKHKENREWSRQWLLKRSRFSHINLLEEFRFYPEDWHNYLRMDEATYLNLLFTVSPQKKKKGYRHEASNITS
jgi:hypothetical protein